MTEDFSTPITAAPEIQAALVRELPRIQWRVGRQALDGLLVFLWVDDDDHAQAELVTLSDLPVEPPPVVHHVGALTVLAIGPSPLEFHVGHLVRDADGALALRESD